ncbi:MAG TPA: flavodoxin domain-containing protein [Gaiellaceae bacterium]|jgi:menaquinone-dependent protoporphyrinogen oxidase|nr:flavodoxin domain-containing protein [Gaiellaceae bacterium]
MDKLLIAYASKHGSTLDVAETIGAAIRETGVRVSLHEASGVEGLEEYDAVILGAPIYMGRWHRDAHRFLRRHAGELEATPFAVFALGPLHDDPAEWTKARAVLSSALEGRPAPAAVEVFGGKIDPAELRFPFSKMPAGDVRDWTAIDAWALRLPALLAPAATV